MNDLRDLILKRVEEIKNSFGRDLFDRNGWYRYRVSNGETTQEIIIKDWDTLSDEDLVKRFEVLVARAYQQR